jgi:pimeloyl-ACP methyl ester carboxylesterase
MGGKVAMTLALSRPAALAGLVVADIAPVVHAPALRGYVAAMRGIPLHPGLTRREADALLAAAVPQPAIRGFLLLNLRFDGAVPAWRLNLPAIDAAMPLIEGFPDLTGPYPGPTLFLAGERSDYIRPEHAGRIAALFPQAERATIPAAGHWVHADNPDAFVALVAAFLRARP